MFCKYFMSRKDIEEAGQDFEKFKNLVEHYTGKKVEVVDVERAIYFDEENINKENINTTFCYKLVKRKCHDEPFKRAYNILNLLEETLIEKEDKDTLVKVSRAKELIKEGLK